MFSLFRGAYGEITRKDEFFVALLGLDGAGKTTYLERLKAHFDRHYCGRNLAKIGPTVGLNHVRIPLKDIVLNVWDLGGQAELRSLWGSYLAECHALVFVVDSADVQRLPEVFSALETIFAIERICQLPLMILFNKCDLDQPKNEEAAVALDGCSRDSAETLTTTTYADGNCTVPGARYFNINGSAAGGDSSTPTPNPNSLISSNTGTTTAASATGGSATACPPVIPSSSSPPPPLVSPATLCSSSGSGWQSFELDNCDERVVVVVAAGASYSNGAAGGDSTTTDDCWEQLSSSTSSSTTLDQQRRHINNNSDQNGLMERFRRQYFNNHISSRHQADVAIFSVSALQNVNVKRSVTWLTNALSSTIQRHL